MGHNLEGLLNVFQLNVLCNIVINRCMKVPNTYTIVVCYKISFFIIIITVCERVLSVYVYTYINNRGHHKRNTDFPR